MMTSPFIIEKFERVFQKYHYMSYNYIPPSHSLIWEEVIISAYPFPILGPSVRWCFLISCGRNNTMKSFVEAIWNWLLPCDDSKYHWKSNKQGFGSGLSLTGSGSNLSGQTGSGIHGQSGLNMMLLPSKLFVQPITNNTSMLFDTLDTYLYDAYQSPKCWNLGLQHTMPQHSCFTNSIRGCCVYKHTSLCFVLFF